MRSRTKIVLVGAGALLAVAASAAPALAQGIAPATHPPTSAWGTATSMNAMMGTGGKGTGDMGAPGGQGMAQMNEEMMSSVPGMAVMMRQNPQMARIHEKMCDTSPSSAPALR